MIRSSLPTLAAIGALALSACGGSATAVGDGADGSRRDAAPATAEALLGDAEDELPADVRVGRRGRETFALTEDYVLGRLTVELDDDGTGTYRVTSVVVELPDGPETLTAG